MIFDDFFRALSQIGDARFQTVLWRAVGLTIVLLVAVSFGFVWLVDWLLPESWTLPFGWELGTGLISAGAVIGVIGLSVFLMFPVASVFVGLYLDEVAGAVEDRFHPTLPTVAPPPFLDALADSLRFLLLVIVANVLALVVYLFATVFAPFVFWAVNGFLLGREYFQLAASRRLGPDGARDLARRHRGEIWLAGALMAVPMSVPVLNLVVPVLGAATFTHMFHRLVKS